VRRQFVKEAASPVRVRQPIIFFSASFLRKKQSFFLKNDALKEFLWAAHNDKGVMRQPLYS
jgi:hypothetical protein